MLRIILIVTLICLVLSNCQNPTQTIQENTGNTFAWQYSGYNDIVSPPTNQNICAIDARYNGNDSYDVYMARRAGYSRNEKIEFLRLLNIDIDNPDPNKTWVSEKFGNNFQCDPAFCLNRVDDYPQIIARRLEYGFKMVHYWRHPNGTWVQQAVLNTRFVGSPTMISNKIAPHNLEVVYIDYTDFKLKHIWREAQGGWHEVHTILPLLAGYEIHYNHSADPSKAGPSMAQTANGIIHVAAIVRNISDGGFRVAYWNKGAHDGSWNFIGLCPVNGTTDEERRVQVVANNTAQASIFHFYDFYVDGYCTSGNEIPYYYSTFDFKMPDTYLIGFGAGSVTEWISDPLHKVERILVSFYGYSTQKNWLGWTRK